MPVLPSVPPPTERLVRFALTILAQWHQDAHRAALDGAEIQELAERSGLIQPQRRHVPCEEGCACVHRAPAGSTIDCAPIRPDIWALVLHEIAGTRGGDGPPCPLCHAPLMPTPDRSAWWCPTVDAVHAASAGLSGPSLATFWAGSLTPESVR